MPRAKAKRFASDGYQRWLREDKDFLARALNDTAYISRIAKEYLTLICPPNKVRVIPGRMTAMLRGKFGLNGILSESKDKKTRDDHRHHAVDAAVIAVTDQSLLQQFAIANSRAREKGLERLVENVPLPWSSFRDHVERAVNAIKTSHKPDHGYQGAMHEETAWGLHEDGTVSRYVLGDNQAVREKVRKKLNVIPINATGDKGRHGLDNEGSPLPYKGYVGGSNYCIEIVSDEKGRWCGEVVSTFCAYQIIREYGEDEGFKKLRSRNTSQSGKPLVMRLMKNDIVSFENSGERKLFRVVVINSAGQTSFANVNEANVDSRNRNKKDSFKYITKYSGPLQKLRCRFVKLSVLGDKNEYK